MVQLIQNELNALSPTSDQLGEIINYLTNTKFSRSDNIIKSECKRANAILKKAHNKSNYNTLIQGLEHNESYDQIKSRVLYGLSNKLKGDLKFENGSLRSLKSNEIDELVRY